MSRLLSPAQRRRLLELPNEIRELKLALRCKYEEIATIRGDIQDGVRLERSAQRADRERPILDYLVTHSFTEAAKKFNTTKGTVSGIAYRHGGLENIRAIRSNKAA